ncbi:MAG: hypothetical protein ATN34_05280 [Epulopiscium sp. Nele67-Bin002]|nr:MAG: hypothetical protein ATN34_05280 [Epulopiscium sp. Nele67-Bin002]OON92246.1 MAG: hypothetical protein ATN33_07665 [Epulopiscium sp. Nele67-Bin001]
MAVTIIKNNNGGLSNGETRVINRLRALYQDDNSTAYIYMQPKIGDLAVDFIILDNQRGICIVETKDWLAEDIQSVDETTIVLQDIIENNPLHEMEQFVATCRGILESEIGAVGKIFAHTILINITDAQFEEFPQLEPLRSCFSNEQYRAITLGTLFDEEEGPIDNLELVKTALLPEIRVYGDLALDSEQENFVRRMPYGHYLVTGMPGSGKTIILIARAIHLIKENPDWRIKILTYNNSMALIIAKKLNIIAQYYRSNPYLNNVNLNRISVNTFHKTALDTANFSADYLDEVDMTREWWDDELPATALEKAEPKYDAVLIDEYQDFKTDWIRLAIKLCKDYEYTNSSGTTHVGVNLFLAGDTLQGIYNPVNHHWFADFELDMRGRIKYLKTCYRTGKQNTFLAIKFLQNHPRLSYEVNKFYKADIDVDIKFGECNECDNIEYLEGGYEGVCDKIQALVDEGTELDEILVLCKTQETCEDIISSLPQQLSCAFVTDADHNQLTNHIKFSTYQSSKGLEVKTVILVDTDQFTSDSEQELLDRKLFYVGITRALENLVIHANNFEEPSFAAELKAIVV